MRHFPPLISMALLAALSGCATYQIGNQTLYPAHIETVYVPIIESASFRRNLGERLTEAVMKEIELRTPYKVTGDPNADSVLRCRLVSETKRVVIAGRSGDPTQLQVDFQVEVSWTDRRGAALRQTDCLPLPAEIASVTGNATLTPEVGQSIATAQQEAIQSIAQQIVGMMESPW
ncbi:MAG: LptE family protein [Patescibacteria group bacterium]|nr:LptE family protein [Patescibacteria group bacterium]